MLAVRFRRWSALPLALSLLVLAACGVGATGQDATPPQPAASSSTSSPTSTPTATPATWQPYTDYTAGYRLMVPPGFSQTPASPNISDSIDVYSFMCDSSCAKSSVSPNLAGLHELDVTSQIGRDGSVTPSCPQNAGGTPASVGSGITGYQRENFTLPPTPAPGQGHGPGWLPSLEVSFVTGGVLVDIKLSGALPTDSFVARYGPTWQHILGSFVPGTTFPNSHPCG